MRYRDIRQEGRQWCTYSREEGRQWCTYSREEGRQTVYTSRKKDGRRCTPAGGTTEVYREHQEGPRRYTGTSGGPGGVVGTPHNVGRGGRAGQGRVLYPARRVPGIIPHLILEHTLTPGHHPASRRITWHVSGRCTVGGCPATVPWALFLNLSWVEGPGPSCSSKSCLILSVRYAPASDLVFGQ